MKVKIRVTEEDIKNGIREDDQQCPTALALRRELNASYNIHVEDGGSGLYIENTITGEILKADRDYSVIENFIRSFDKGKEVKPFEVEVNLEVEEKEDYYDD